MISEQQYTSSAQAIDCSIAAIKAVAEVESNGCGFLPGNKCRILFEPHVFWRILQTRGKDPEIIVKQNPSYSAILYPVWGTLPYGKYSEQWDKMGIAQQVDASLALMAASWGKFQIMGENFRSCAFSSIEDFAASMQKVDSNKFYDQQDECEHLVSFVNFLFSEKLDVFLRNKDWKNFAKHYNGPGYKNNPDTILDDYDYKLAEAYNKFSTLK